MEFIFQLIWYQQCNNGSCSSTELEAGAADNNDYVDEDNDDVITISI